MRNCNDYATLLLFLKSKNQLDEIKKLITEAEEAGQLNVAFSAAYIAGENEKCTKILLASNKYAEAAIFARSHCPSMTSECVAEWKKHMPNERMSDAIADPAEYPTLFDELIPESE